jgi:DUF1680 family protein
MLVQLQNDLTHGFASRLDALTERAATDLFSQRIESSSQQFAWWDSETRGNWLWGYTMMAGLAGLPEHQARVNELIAQLKNTQDNDGYLGIYSPASRYQHGNDENGELWGQGRALLALLAHYEITGDETSLRAAQRAADLTIQHYGPGRSYFRQPQTRNDLTGMTHGLCYVDVVEWLYDLTNDSRYRDFGVWLYEDFNRMQLPFPNDDLTQLNLLNRNHYFNGHAVHTVEHLRALFFAAAHGNNPETKTALQNALWKLNHYALPSGAVIGDEGMHGLPLPDIGYEYCTLTELLFSLTSAMQKFSNPDLADWIEVLAFNAAQGARFSDGTGLAYLSLDQRIAAHNHRPDSYSHLHDKHGRFKFSPTHEDVACCCNPNSLRLLPHYISRMWLQSEKTLAAVLYGPCVLKTKLDDVEVTITSETDYPFEDSIRFTVNPLHALDFELLLRKPAWSPTVTVDGVTAHEHDGWLAIHKTWQPGDIFTITFHPHVEVAPYPNGEYAVKRGALQYVYPIAHELHAIKGYPLTGFHDYEVTPTDIAQAYQPVILDASQPEYGLRYEQVSVKTTPVGWDQPYVKLEADSYQLVPMGCTILRRSSFPLKR